MFIYFFKRKGVAVITGPYTEK